MATSGIEMPAALEKRSTVPTSHWCVGSVELLMTFAPVLHLAMGLLISSEMNAPPKPITSEKPSSEVRFSPLAVMKPLSPRTLTAMPSTTMTATLVSRKSAMRFMGPRR